MVHGDGLVGPCQKGICCLPHGKRFYTTNLDGNRVASETGRSACGPYRLVGCHLERKPGTENRK